MSGLLIGGLFDAASGCPAVPSTVLLAARVVCRLVVAVGAVDAAADPVARIAGHPRVSGELLGDLASP